LNYNHAIKVLFHIEFIYNNIDQHWAETDGKTIWLNTYKTFSDELLETTLLHEAFHGLVRRNAPPPSGYAPPPSGYAPPPSGYAPPPSGYAHFIPE
jgi:hypothetical protein